MPESRPSTSLGTGPSTPLGTGPSTPLGTGPSTSLGTGPSIFLRMGRLFWPLSALALLLAINAVFNRSFFHLEMRDGRLVGSMVDVLRYGAPVTLLSLGMSLVIATSGIDLSVGAVMAINGAVAASLIARPPDGPLSFIDVHGSTAVVIGLSLLVALAAGAWNGMLVVLLGLQPIVATLVLMVAGRGMAQLLTNARIVTFPETPFSFLARGTVLSLPFPILLSLLAALLIGLFSRGTALGLFIESVGNNPKASRLAGVPAGVVKIAVYALCGLCAGIAGLVVTAEIQGADANHAGLGLELDAILSVSLGGASLSGGRFSLLGTVIGAVLLQTLTTMLLGMNVPPALTIVLKGAVVVLVCLLQSPKFRGKFQRGRQSLRGGRMG
jgi:galactofuranose transport system permease protein